MDSLTEANYRQLSQYLVAEDMKKLKNDFEQRIVSQVIFTRDFSRTFGDDVTAIGDRNQKVSAQTRLEI